MDAGGAKGKQKSDINVTPLIDIVLVLLIVFIVMVPGLDKATKIVVPQVQVTNIVPPDPNNILIQIDQDGALMLQQDKTDAQGLKDLLPEAVMRQPLGYRKVFLKVDEDVKFQVMVDVLDAIRVAGDIAKKKSLENIDKFQGQDGGDTKVAVAIRKRTAAVAPVS